ncbi:hypothetical protein N7540_013054 [Penicillium herquei]|nr:hypothetical protein N7540_013054 [Penicillium herquei]
MLTVDVMVWSDGPNDERIQYSWISLIDELSFNELIEVENKLLLLQKYVASERSKTDLEKSQLLKSKGHLVDGLLDVSVDSERGKETQIEACLEDTVKNISSMGLGAWLDADKRRKLMIESSIAKSLLAYVKGGVYISKPIFGARKEQIRGRNETMLRLIYEHFGLACALLVIYSFSTATLQGFSFQHIAHILRCFTRREGHLYCGALEAEAADILSEDGLADVPPTEPPEGITIDEQPQTMTNCPSHAAIGNPVRPSVIIDVLHSSEIQSTAYVDLSQHNLPYTSVDDTYVTDKEESTPESAAPRASLKRKRNLPERMSGDKSNFDNTRETLGLSAAECNIKSLAMLQASSEFQRLLLITAALGGNMVPLDLIFRRVQSDQKRWSANGEINVVTSSMVGLETSFGIINPDQISSLMAEWSHVTHQKLLRSPDERYYTIPPPLKTSIKHLLCSDDDKILLQSLRLICFVLPRERLWEQE